MCFLMESTITLPKRWIKSLVKPLDAAANVQEIQKIEEHVEQHHKYTSLWNSTD